MSLPVSKSSIAFPSTGTKIQTSHCSLTGSAVCPYLSPRPFLLSFPSYSLFPRYCPGTFTHAFLCSRKTLDSTVPSQHSLIIQILAYLCPPQKGFHLASYIQWPAQVLLYHVTLFYFLQDSCPCLNHLLSLIYCSLLYCQSPPISYLLLSDKISQNAVS